MLPRPGDSSLTFLLTSDDLPEKISIGDLRGSFLVISHPWVAHSLVTSFPAVASGHGARSSIEKRLKDLTTSYK
jgi:hypothetical protein